MRKWVVIFVVLNLILMTPIPVLAAHTDVTTFDALTDTTVLILNGYGGFDWNKFYVLDTVNYYCNSSGYLDGLASCNYGVYNAWVNPDRVSNDSFEFIGAYLTGAWRTGLNITVEGYCNDTLFHTRMVVANHYVPTWFEMDFVNIDPLRYNSYAGTKVLGLKKAGAHFAIDNFTYGVVIPIPGAILLGSIGVYLVGWRRRRRLLKI